jgi:predicted nuclease with TOPRIM domain
VKKLLPDVRSKLEKTSDEMTRIMEMITGKEKVINKNFAHIVDEYKVHADQLKEVKQQTAQLNENYQKQQEILLEITERLEDVQVVYQVNWVD